MAETPAKTPARSASGEKKMNKNDVKNRARDMADTALKTLEAIMEGEGQATAKLAAAREVLDRGYGPSRPPAGAAPRKAAPGPAPYTVVVQRFTDPPDPTLEDFD